jgi:signal peptidase II
MMRKPRLWQRLAALGLVAALAALDQLAKVWAQGSLQTGSRVVVIPGILGLRLARNSGISFGMLSDSPGAMAAVTVVTGLVMLGGVVLLALGKAENHGQLWSAALVLAGGIGNFIDRVFQGYVVDYFEFLFVRFAIFNLADVFITLGMAWLMAMIFWGESRRRKAEAPPEAET